MSATRVSVIGAGGHAKVVVRALLDLGHTVDGIYDDDPRRWGTVLLGCPVSGPVERVVRRRRFPAVVAVGDNRVRRCLAEQHPLPWLTVVHPSALVDPTVSLGPGAVVLQRAVIQPDACVGAHAIVNTAATVDHDCQLGDYTHVAPGGHLAGAVRLETGALVGIGGAAVPGVTIGRWTTVGAGGVVTADLPAHVLAVGVPARSIRCIEPAEAPEAVPHPCHPARRNAA